MWHKYMKSKGDVKQNLTGQTCSVRIKKYSYVLPSEI